MILLGWHFEDKENITSRKLICRNFITAEEHRRSFLSV